MYRGVEFFIMVGRPKTLDKSHALATALEGYWREGVYGMSVNEVCRRACISKPGLYREFGGEDGLLTAVLDLYDKTVLSLFRDLLEANVGFEKSMHIFTTRFFGQTGHPPGCLLAELRLAYPDLGESTQAKVQSTVTKYRGMLRQWLQNCQASGEVDAHADLDFAAQYIDSQLFLAATQAQRGDSTDEIAKRLMTSRRVFKPQDTADA